MLNSIRTKSKPSIYFYNTCPSSYIFELSILASLPTHLPKSEVSGSSCPCHLNILLYFQKISKPYHTVSTKWLSWDPPPSLARADCFRGYYINQPISILVTLQKSKMVYSITKENWKDTGRDHFYHEAQNSAKIYQYQEKQKQNKEGKKRKIARRLMKAFVTLVPGIPKTQLHCYMSYETFVL